MNISCNADIYYRVKGSALFLLLTEFINIQTNGNPVMTIQTITILVIAIAKLDWRSAIRLKLRLLYFYTLIDFICANIIWPTIIWLTIIWLTLTCPIWFRRRFLLTSRNKRREDVPVANPVFSPLFSAIVATRYVIR